MKNALIAAAAAMLTTTLFIVPVTMAANCTSSRHDELAIPIDGAPGVAAGSFYLYANATDSSHPERNGVWENTNGVSGLQVTSCKIGAITVYPADHKATPA
ncbi:MAG TPA: hypothetical protein VM370_11400 [Candidatus Thermoplasmatota archaeon]|nr:hypothetical protein [Candidatus Thermoplasmatota archaeon]